MALFGRIATVGMLQLLANSIPTSPGSDQQVGDRWQGVCNQLEKWLPG
jgi:hypothetical protein